ncbi:MAG: 2-hydroxychromene-2-carboxylate isomerase [Luteimonas sp.]|nr:2-hydroxychromene-2-carboxylate isomerase [Luteimonas sp.]
MDPIDFYFDFISPYAFLASTRIEQLAQRHGRTVRWHAFRLGVTVVKVMGLRPMLETPLKGDYTLKDVARVAKMMGEPLVSPITLPDPRPAARLLYSVSTQRRGEFAKALLRAQWAGGLDIGKEEVLRGVAGELGMEPAAVDHALRDPGPKEALAAATKSAIDRGVFGSPTCAVGTELFWGTDRLWLLDLYLSAGERYIPFERQAQAVLGVHLQ